MADRVYYHAVPADRLPDVFREGLLVGSTPVFQDMGYSKRLYLAHKPESLGAFIGLIATADKSTVPSGRWAILRVLLPSNAKVRQDPSSEGAQYGWSYISVPVPPKNLSIVGLVDQPDNRDYGVFGSMEVEVWTPGLDREGFEREYLDYVLHEGIRPIDKRGRVLGSG